MKTALLALWALALSLPAAAAPKINSRDYHIDAIDPGIKLFVREKMAEGARATEDNVVLFVHGATFPSTPDFDLQFKDYSWADWMVNHGYVIYMFDKRNYGFSAREKAMDDPPAANKPRHGGAQEPRRSFADERWLLRCPLVHPIAWVAEPS